MKTFKNPDVVRSAAPIIELSLEERVLYLEKELRKTIIELEILKLKLAGEL